MSPQSGNAWAQMRARELQQRPVDLGKVAIPLKGPVMPNRSNRPTSSCQSSGLDYNADLALPMPRPRHATTDESIDLEKAAKPNVLTKPNVTNKRSVTEPARTFENTGSTNVVDNEKKRSKVSMLKSKFSLKDIGKEFRKNTTMGSLSKSESVLDDADQSQVVDNHDFNEEKLYVPKPRQPGVYPSSAPPFPTSTFRDASQGNFSQTSRDQRTENEEQNNEKLNIGLLTRNNAVCLNRNSEPVMHIDALLLDGSSPAARTGEFANSGRPQFVKGQPSIRSMIAGKEQGSPSSLGAISFFGADSLPSSPPTYEKLEDMAGKAEAAAEPSTYSHKYNQESNMANEKKFPLIISASQPSSSSSASQEGKQRALVPTAPAFEPRKFRTRDEHVHGQGRADDFYGVTSHGGYAPPPSHPGYRNTMAMEQLLNAHVEGIHHHINNAVHRITKCFENTNNWTMNQVLRQVDAMSDVLRVVNSRTAGQSEAIRELQQLMISLQVQVQVETRQMEERVIANFQNQINRLRGELDASPQKAVSLCNPAPDSKNPSAELQKTQNTTEIVRDSEKRPNKKRQRHVRKGYMVMKGNTECKKSEHNKAGEGVSGSASPFSKRAERTPSENIPTPTAAFRTPDIEESKIEISTQSQAKRGIRKHPGQESSGSPESKAPKPNNHVHAHPEPENGQALTFKSLENQGTDEKPRNEDLRTPHRKGMFGFRRRCDSASHTGNRFMHTPRRNKEAKGSNEQNPLPSTPTAPPVSTGAVQTAPAVAESPSSIHPALRNTRQQQIMAGRECQSLAQTGNRATQNTSTQGRSGLRYSQSHQGFGNRTPRASNHSSASPFRAPPSSSSSSHRIPNVRHLAANYAPPAQPSFISSSGTFVSAPHSANNNLWVSQGIPPHPLHAPPVVPVATLIQLGTVDMGTSNRYHEAYENNSSEINQI